MHFPRSFYCVLCSRFVIQIFVCVVLSYNMCLLTVYYDRFVGIIIIKLCLRELDIYVKWGEGWLMCGFGGLWCFCLVGSFCYMVIISSTVCLVFGHTDKRQTRNY